MSMSMLHSPVARDHAQPPPGPGLWEVMLTISQQLREVLLYIRHAAGSEGCLFRGGVHVVEYCRAGFGERL